MGVDVPDPASRVAARDACGEVARGATRADMVSHSRRSRLHGQKRRQQGGRKSRRSQQVPHVYGTDAGPLLVTHRTAATGAQLRAVITGFSVRRILELISADQLLLVYPSLTDAQAYRSH